MYSPYIPVRDNPPLYVKVPLEYLITSLTFSANDFLNSFNLILFPSSNVTSSGICKDSPSNNISY